MTNRKRFYAAAPITSEDALDPEAMAYIEAALRDKWADLIRRSGGIPEEIDDLRYIENPHFGAIAGWDDQGALIRDEIRCHLVATGMADREAGEW